VSVHTLYHSQEEKEIGVDDPRVRPVSAHLFLYTDRCPQWSEILPKVNLGPSSRHLFKISEEEGSRVYSHVKLNMFPDGGIVSLPSSFPSLPSPNQINQQARFRVYGFVQPVIPADPSEVFDLAHVFAGGAVPSTSDQHFGVGANLILPGRGKF
jgi:allantoicase